MTNASEATLLSNLAPILVPIVALLMLRVAVTWVQNGATSLSLLGLLLIVSPKFTSGSGYLGDFMLFASSMAYAIFIVLSKRLSTMSVESAFSMIISIAIFLAPISILLGGFNLLVLRLGSEAWLSVLYLGVVCSVVAIALYLQGLRSISASQSATLLFVELLTGLLLAATLLGESLSLSEATGTLTILAAMGLSTLDGQSKEVVSAVTSRTMNHLTGHNVAEN